MRQQGFIPLLKTTTVRNSRLISFGSIHVIKLQQREKGKEEDCQYQKKHCNGKKLTNSINTSDSPILYPLSPPLPPCQHQNQYHNHPPHQPPAITSTISLNTSPPSHLTRTLKLSPPLYKHSNPDNDFPNSYAKNPYTRPFPPPNSTVQLFFRGYSLLDTRIWRVGRVWRSIFHS